MLNVAKISNASYPSSGTYSKQLEKGVYFVTVNRYSVSSGEYGGLYIVDLTYNSAINSNIIEIKSSNVLNSITVADNYVLNYETNITYVQLTFTEISN